MIISAQNQKIKLVRLLMGRPRDRREASAFVVEGVRLIEEAEAAGWSFRFVLFSKSTGKHGQDLVKSLAARQIEVEEVSAELLNSLSDTETTQGILAVLNQSPIPFPPHPSFILIPDSIRDPGNLGSLIRTAAAAGVQAILIPPETTDAFAPKVVRAGMGAHFRLPIISSTWEQIQILTGDLQVYLAEMEGKLSCWEADFQASLALIIGGEAEGASESACKLSTHQVSIPMPGKMESLNAAVAGAILMFEVVRQRNK